MKKILTVLSVASAVFLTACDKNYKPEPYRTKEDKERAEHGSIFGEQGLKLFSSDNNADSGGIGVNAHLWRASLETFKFIPLTQTDPFGGIIISDWYSDEKSPNERIKVNIFIMDTVLRADAIRVSLFKQTFKNGQWVDSAVNKDVNRKLENKILYKAREIRISEKPKEKED